MASRWCCAHGGEIETQRPAQHKTANQEQSELKAQATRHGGRPRQINAPSPTSIRGDSNMGVRAPVLNGRLKVVATFRGLCIYFFFEVFCRIDNRFPVECTRAPAPVERQTEVSISLVAFFTRVFRSLIPLGSLFLCRHRVASRVATVPTPAAR